MSSLSQIKVQLALPEEDITLQARLKGVWQLIRADKPIGYLLLIWPALWAMWVAGEGSPDWYVTLIFLLGGFLVRSAGCASNGYIDRRIGSRSMTSCQHPLAMGIIKPHEAMILFIVMTLLVTGLVLTLNWLTIILSLLGIVMVVAYPFVKRFTYLSQIFLALSFGWFVPMAYAAVSGELNAEVWVLYAASVSWILAYETEHAMISRYEDMKNGIKSTVQLFGRFEVWVIGILQALVIMFLLLIGDMSGRGWFYFSGILLCSVYFVRQQMLLHSDRRLGAFPAFLNNNCFGMTVFLILVVDFLLV